MLRDIAIDESVPQNNSFPDATFFACPDDDASDAYLLTMLNCVFMCMYAALLILSECDMHDSCPHRQTFLASRMQCPPGNSPRDLREHLLSTGWRCNRSSEMRLRRASERIVKKDSREVRELAQHGEPKEDIGPLGAGRGVQGVVDKVRDEGSEAPVVAAVLE